MPFFDIIILVRVIIIYTVEKIVEKVLYSNSTSFVEIKYLNRVKKELKNVKYNMYEPFIGATKVILYNKMPNIKIYEIVSSNDLRHQDILGTLYSLNISDEMFGDVVIWNNRYFIIILSSIDNYIKSNLISIRNSKVDLIEKDPYYLKDYKQEYEEFNIIVPSIRVDVIVSKIINSSRSNALEKIKNGDIYLNYELLTKPTYMLKENDQLTPLMLKEPLPGRQLILAQHDSLTVSQAAERFIEMFTSI